MPYLAPSLVSQSLGHHDPEVNPAVDTDRVAGENGREFGIVMNVIPQLPSPARSRHEIDRLRDVVIVTAEEHGRAPVRPTHRWLRPGEGVTENVADLAVGHAERDTEIRSPNIELGERI